MLWISAGFALLVAIGCPVCDWLSRRRDARIWESTREAREAFEREVRSCD